jgi:hypothetical protein
MKSTFEKPTVSLSLVVMFQERRMNDFTWKPYGGEELFEADSLVKVAKDVARRMIVVGEKLGGFKMCVWERILRFELTRFNPDTKGHEKSRSPLLTHCVLDDRKELLAITEMFTSLVNDFLLEEVEKRTMR